MNRTRSATLIAALLFASSPAGAAAQGVSWGAESRVWFTGASNIRGFTCRAGQVQGGLELAPGETPAALLARDGAPAAAALRIPVAGLNCGIRAQNRHLRHTLHADVHPAIEFRLERYTMLAADSAAQLWMHGTLAIAGKEQPVTVPGVVVRDAEGAIHVQGAQEIRPTEFGVKPPRRFLGLLRVRDQVTVHYDIVIPEPPPALGTR